MAMKLKIAHLIWEFNYGGDITRTEPLKAYAAMFGNNPHLFINALYLSKAYYSYNKCTIEVKTNSQAELDYTVYSTPYVKELIEYSYTITTT